MPNFTRCASSLARGLTLPCVFALTACDDASETANPFRAEVCAHEAPTPAFSVTPTDARTTSAEVALANLDAQLAGYRGLLAVSPTDPERAAAVVDRLLTRSQFLGRPDDFDEALAITETVLAADRSAPALELRARVLAAVHLWDDALTLLDEALAKGADPTLIQRTRDTIEVAIGTADLEAVLARANTWAESAPSVASHGARANALWKLGRYDEADQAFVAAMATYRDVAPWVVAWSDFQRGVMWSESANRPDLAADLYRAAVLRLPAYHVAVVHHSELLSGASADEAIALLEPVSESSGDPEARGLLARLLDERDQSRANDLRATARTAYEDLLERHRAAYAEHGAEFFLNVVDEPETALELALENLEDRPTSGAFELAVGAAFAAGDRDLACSLVDRARREASPTPIFCQVMHDAFESCR